MSELRFCFVSFEDNEQSEVGDTFTHTWVKPAWGYCVTKYVYFWGSVGGVTSPSTSPFFSFHNTYNIPPPVEATFYIPGSTSDATRRWSTSRFVLNLVTTIDNFGFQTVGQKQFGSGMRFTNVTIPKLSYLWEVKLKFQSAALVSTPCQKIRLRSEIAPNSAVFTDLANFDARAWSASPLYWLNIPTWVAAGLYESPDVKTLFQEVISQPAWLPGNPVTFLFDDFLNNCTGDRRPWSYDGNPAKSPSLWVKYSPP
ncbi:MAG: hypothetical protein MUP81_00795 [Dehalococcoidia bacterium]|nr:hypothetical protein [Dehalococcoidia bacterium]